MRTPKSVVDKRYEDKHKEERKAKSMIWGTSVPREYAEEINNFLAEHKLTKVRLIELGYEALKKQAALEKKCSETRLAKYLDGYDDFFYFEEEAFEKKNE